MDLVLQDLTVQILVVKTLKSPLSTINWLWSSVEKLSVVKNMLNVEKVFDSLDFKPETMIVLVHEKKNFRGDHKRLEIFRKGLAL